MTLLELVRKDEDVLQLSIKAKKIEAEVCALTINNDDDLIVAIDYLGRIKKVKTLSEERRKSHVKPLQDTVTQINAYFKSFITPINNADSSLRIKVAKYQQVQERKRKEEEERLRKLAEKEQRRLERQAAKKGEPTPPPIVVPVTEAPIRNVSTETASMGFRTVWEFEVNDETKVPREFLTVNEKAIRAAVKAGVRNIPGVRIYQTSQVAVRTK